METLERFQRRLEDHFDGLTKSQQRLATYLLGNYDEAAFLSAAALADRLRISEATVVRFAKAVGYRGVPELRRSLQQVFRLKVNPAARLEHKLDELRADRQHILNKTVAMEVHYLTEALHSIRPAQVDRAVAILCGARRVFVFGLGPARVLADLAQLRLRRFGVMTISVTHSGRDVLEEILLLRPDDVVLAAGFQRATAELAAVLGHARSIGCKTVLITDTLGLAFRNKADVILAARRGPVSTFHSLTVPMAVLNALLLGLASARPRRSLAGVRKLEALRAAYGLDILADHRRDARRMRPLLLDRHQ